MANDGSNVGWFQAPGTSHLFAFRFRDNRLYSLPVSQLDVIFKTKAGVQGTEGSYECVNPDIGQDLYDRMAKSPHPYGQVLYPNAIKTKALPWVVTKKVP